MQLNNATTFGLVNKYNVQGPRYTSYPTALHFKSIFNRKAVWDKLNCYHQVPRKISLYIHIPFCQSLCWYCGCTKVIKKDRTAGTRYIGYLKKELLQQRELLHDSHQVVQVHWGGGTPTFLAEKEIVELIAFINEHFNVTGNAEIGIEIDPREATRNKIETLARAGFNRTSLGIQDVNPEVQQAIHRIQPMEQNSKVVRWLQEAGIESVNLDLIYGLPLQTPNNFESTLHKTLALKATRYAVYSYAHVPWIKPSQKLIKMDDLPDTNAKLTMLLKAIDILTASGYEYIGMDHFSKENGELAQAIRKGTLQRNFQGYSTHSGVDIVGAGMSSISSIGPFYVQNTKDLEEYYERIEEGVLAADKFLELSKDDLIRRDVIMNIMCHNGLNLEQLSKRWNVDASAYFAEELHQIDQFEADGLIVKLSNGFQTTERGKLFIRNIAMIFDDYLSKKPIYKKAYSKTI